MLITREIELVKVHLHNIYQKVDVERRIALLRYAQEKGLA